MAKILNDSEYERYKRRDDNYTKLHETCQNALALPGYWVTGALNTDRSRSSLVFFAVNDSSRELVAVKQTKLSTLIFL